MVHIFHNCRLYKTYPFWPIERYLYFGQHLRIGDMIEMRCPFIKSHKKTAHRPVLLIFFFIRKYLQAKKFKCLITAVDF